MSSKMGVHCPLTNCDWYFESNTSSFENATPQIEAALSHHFRCDHQPIDFISEITALRKQVGETKNSRHFKFCLEFGFPTYTMPRVPRGSFCDLSKTIGDYRPERWAVDVDDKRFSGATPVEAIEAALVYIDSLKEQQQS